jgi:hypothetical protein
MRNGVGSWNRVRSLAIVAAGLLALAPACGDDDQGSGDQDDDEPNGEACSTPGYTETCTCSSQQPAGYRECTEDMIWTACTCRAAPDAGSNECDFAGQRVNCFPCPGESEGRTTMCLQNRTFDCSCGDAGASRDGG